MDALGPTQTLQLLAAVAEGIVDGLTSVGGVPDTSQVRAMTAEMVRRLLAGEGIGTVFVPAGRKMSRRDRWIAHASRPAGTIVVDAGAARALTQRGKSLLPSGITAVVGRFAKGAIVAVTDPAGETIARGLTNYSAEQIQQIKGLKTSQISVALGDKPYDEVIHRNNMTVE